MDSLGGLLRDQDGVVSRRQVLATGMTTVALARAQRRGELVVLHPTVYVEHNGPLTWQQRAWAAVLHAWPAALCLDSALRAAEGPGRRGRDEKTLHVAVDRHRRLTPMPGVRLHRMSGFSTRTNWNLAPPRIGYDDSILDLAARARTDLDAIATLAEACGARRTTAARLLTRLAERPRVARRTWIEAVLRDVAEGTCSVLEHGYLDRVVRPHALPRGELQAPRATTGGRVRRDVEHTDLGLAIELDGAVFHTAPDDRDRDLARDLDAAVEADLRTVRLGYRQVYADACRTAAQLALLMTRHGWTGRPTRCPECGAPDEPG